MTPSVKKVVLVSKNVYLSEYDEILCRLIDEKVLLFCAVGKDGEFWHDVTDKIIVKEKKEIFL